MYPYPPGYSGYPTVAETEITEDKDSNLFAIGIFAVIFLLIIGLFAYAYSNKSITAVTPSVVVSPTETIDPIVRFNYRLDSPTISADLQSILTYLLERGTYASTDQPWSDAVNTALKEYSRWTLSSASPPTYYYRSRDQNHRFILWYSPEFNVWQIKPAL